MRSPEEERLLRTVMGDPHSDEPRLAYASWLDELPDPRGQFIRLQVEVARQRRDDGTAREWGESEKASQQLLALGRALWLQPLAPWIDADRLHTPTFHRGFVEHITMDAAAFVSDATALYAVAPIRHLHLTGVAAAIDALAASPALERIVALDLSDNDLTDAHLRTLCTSPHLARLALLDLSRNQLGDESLRTIGAARTMPVLDCLWWNGNQVPDPADRAFYDGDEIIETEMSETGLELESWFGPQPWLHAPARWPHTWPPTCEAY